MNLAILNGNSAVAELLLKHENTDPNISDNYGHTALTLAVWKRNVPLVKRLLKRTDAVTNLNNDGGSPLAIAADDGYEEVVRLLLEREDVKADPRDSAGYYPLLHTAKAGHVGIVKMLLARPDANAGL